MWRVCFIMGGRACIACGTNSFVKVAQQQKMALAANHGFVKYMMYSKSCAHGRLTVIYKWWPVCGQPQDWISCFTGGKKSWFLIIYYNYFISCMEATCWCKIYWNMTISLFAILLFGIYIQVKYHAIYTYQIVTSCYQDSRRWCFFYWKYLFEEVVSNPPSSTQAVTSSSAVGYRHHFSTVCYTQVIPHIS